MKTILVVIIIFIYWSVSVEIKKEENNIKINSTRGCYYKGGFYSVGACIPRLRLECCFSETW